MHIIASSKGFIKEFVITKTSVHDSRALNLLPLSLPEGSEIYADKAYNDYLTEDLIREGQKVQLKPIRKKGSKRKEEESKKFLKRVKRRFIKTIGSELKRMPPAKLYSVTLKGFLMKLNFLVLAFNCS